MAADVAGGVTAVLPWTFVLGLFGLFFKARLSGDPALWKRVEKLEADLAEERKNCAAELAKLQGIIRQLQQAQNSWGNVSRDKPMGGALDTAFPPEPPTPDDHDLLRKLDRVPGSKRKKP